MKTSLIIDTDVALGVWHDGNPRDIDDGFAIVEAINIETIELAAITTVYGNAPHPHVARVAHESSCSKLTVPVWHGANTALRRSVMPPPSVLSRDWPICSRAGVCTSPPSGR
jgi:inosine-uridine nucleoside N-ribohydrolase